MKTPYFLRWRPRSFLGRIVGLIVGVCALAALLVASVIAIWVIIAAVTVAFVVSWWKLRKAPRRHGEIIDVTPVRITPSPSPQLRHSPADRQHPGR